ncbi:MAG: hypothetical protein FRX49_09158 [Trebouxia sp. A1-2]|nr:MAG: hypothetical protein FRX49_09158 [Trebouxia sp. A1-2]
MPEVVRLTPGLGLNWALARGLRGCIWVVDSGTPGASGSSSAKDPLHCRKCACTSTALEKAFLYAPCLVALALSLFQLPVESRDMALQLVVGGSKVGYDASIANMLGLAGSLRSLKLLLQLQQLPHLAENEESVHGPEEV